MRRRRTAVIRFKPTDTTLYGRALELAIQGKPSTDPLRFTNGDLDRVIRRAQREAQAEGRYKIDPNKRPNAPDIPSAFAGRRNEKLPATIQALGYTSVRPVTRGSYELTKGLPSRLATPDPTKVKERYEVQDTLPDAVKDLIPANEQGALARAGESGLLRMFLHVQETYRILAHWSTGGAEMDEVHTAVDQRDTVLVPVEAKSRGASEAFQRHQFTRAVKTLQDLFRGIPIRPVGLKVVDDSTIMLIELNVTTDPEKLKIIRAALFTFVEPKRRSTTNPVKRAA